MDTLVTVVGGGGQAAFVPAVKLHERDDEDWETAHDLNLRHVARAVRRTSSQVEISTGVDNADPARGWVPEIPAGRYGTSEKMAAAAVHLASDEARYVTGRQIVLERTEESRSVARSPNSGESDPGQALLPPLAEAGPGRGPTPDRATASQERLHAR
ncbi:SDR family oxidoreductase [Streptomyces sp. NPDC102467]|uniref:SDR family oxidoreductase n=1 Tax=Streptomyces sp. NPDC102467 TaxID=3366179 RepID=UPI00381225BF